MAYADLFDPSSPNYLSDDLMTQQEALARRRALLAQRAKQAAAQLGIYAPAASPDQPQGWTSAVTGTPMVAPYVKKPLLSQLAPLIADERLAQEDRTLTREEAAQQQRAQAAYQQQIASMPTARSEEQAGPYDPAQGIAPPTRTVEPTLRDTLEWAARGRGVPGFQGVADAVIADRIVKQPEREEARAERQASREGALAEARRRQEADQQFRRQQQEDQQEFRRQQQQESNDLRRDLHAAVRASGGPRGSWQKTGTDENGHAIFENFTTGERRVGSGSDNKPLKNLPAAQSKAFLENSTALNKLDAADAALDTKGGQQATGAVKGVLNAIPGVGGVALNYFDPAGTATRALVADIGSLKIHDRSGAAVTAAEFPRLQPFIPQVGDDRATVKKKLTNFRREYEMAQQDISDYADSQGYKMPEVRKRGAAPSREASGALEGSEPVPGSSILRQPSTKSLSDEDLLRKYR